MGDKLYPDIPRPNPDDQTPGQHGNQTHGIRKAEFALRRGTPFDGHMQTLYIEGLARRGLVESDLDTMGAYGDVVKHTCRLGVLVEMVWDGMQMAGALGDVGAFYQLLRDHGHRFDQAIRAFHREMEIAREQGDVLDYEAILEGESNLDGA